MAQDKNTPRHVAIVMDGNGRWAKRLGLPRIFGHNRGMERVQEIVKAADKLNIKVLTLFAFSTENWNRSKTEVNMLMKAFSRYLAKELDRLNQDNVRLRVIGRDNPLSPELIKQIRQVEKITAGNTGLTLVLALNYGGRAEISDAAELMLRSVNSGTFKLSELNEETFSRFLYAPDLPDPDLIIRTSGELRISNFLLWQIAYAEFYFTEKCWPDFTKQELAKAVNEYNKRQRKFGRVR